MELPATHHQRTGASGNQPLTWAMNVHSPAIVAETFAPLAECVLFALAFRSKGARWPRDYLVITGANLASFGLGELWHTFFR